MAKAKKERPSEPTPKGPKLRKRDRFGAEIGQRIGRARRNVNLATIVSLHKRTVEVDPEKKGISQPVLIGYEDGHYRPGARELKLLSLALRVSPTWLLFGQENLVDKNATPDVPSRLTFAKLFELTDEQKRSAMLALFFGYLTKEERDPWINIIELFLRTRFGDKEFELRQLAVQKLAELMVESSGVAERILETTLTPEKLANLDESFKKDAAKLGLPLEEKKQQPPE